MFDFCKTKHKCDCSGEIDLYIDENDSTKFYYQCRRCGAKYFDKKELKE